MSTGRLIEISVRSRATINELTHKFMMSDQRKGKIFVCLKILVKIVMESQLRAMIQFSE